MARQVKLDSHYRFNDSRRRRRKWLIIVAIILALLLISTFFFDIHEIRIEGNTTVSEQSIRDSLGVKEGMNMIRYLIASQFGKPELSPRIQSLDIYFNWPHTLLVEVKERMVVGYVSYMGMYLCIDETGYVVDSTHYLIEDMPVITGVTIQDFRLGEPLNTSSVSVSQTIMEICAALRKYGLSERVVRIDLTDFSDVRLYTEKLDIRFGEDDDVDRKIQALERILEHDPAIAGILHIEDVDGQVYLERGV
ncbi:MAG: FtsQ-type POTRA domain-containing protein [Firmicutes bacterium]|nr:FtsQ-type POTRA domain-containing protein [Bacillota bacterium]